MKKKLNIFCVLMLVLMAAEVIMGIIMNYSESAQAFRQGWEDGSKGAAGSQGSSVDILSVVLGLIAIYLIIRAFVSFIRFILNVNCDKVFVWDNVRLLRWTGWGILVSGLIVSFYDMMEGFPMEKIYDNVIDDLIFSVFSLIVAEVFAIGLKLKEEQDLTV